MNKKLNKCNYNGYIFIIFCDIIFIFEIGQIRIELQLLASSYISDSLS